MSRSMACFKCEQCGHEDLVPNVSGHLEEPKRCGAEACRATWSLKMVHNRSLYVNKQIVKMQARAHGPCPAIRTHACMHPLNRHQCAVPGFHTA